MNLHWPAKYHPEGGWNTTIWLPWYRIAWQLPAIPVFLLGWLLTFLATWWMTLSIGRGYRVACRDE